MGIAPTLRLLLAELGFELDCLAPNYSALLTFPLGFPARGHCDEIPLTEEKSEAQREKALPGTELHGLRFHNLSEKQNS